MIADQVNRSLVGTFSNIQVCHEAVTHVYFVWYSVVAASCKKFSSGGDNNPDPPQLIVPLTTPDLNPELALEVLHQQVKRPGAHAEYEVW